MGDWLKEYLQYNMGFETDTNDRLNNQNVEAYIKNSNHPTSRTKLTLGWVRFTLLKPGYIEGTSWFSKDEYEKRFGEESLKIVQDGDDKHSVVIKEKSCILDEIQTDMNGSSFLGEDLMEGWESFVIQKFISFIRGSLGIRKIYMPTYGAKQDLYNANPPMYLYKEIPNKFGFSKSSDMENFMLLENCY